MRLQRLDLRRYGKFTDCSIDFGEGKAGRPDLHVIYGPNEAGKSTALSAFLDLLFGIEPRSGYGFLHPYATMRVGALLDLGGEVRTFGRIKRAQNTLLDAHDRPIPEAAILGDLGGIDRKSYRSMFSLDDDTLEEGGESILASQGDLGQLLFSASAGLADLSRSLVDLRGEADRFYRFKAHGGILADLKKRLADLKAERAAIDTLASDHARLTEDREQAERHYGEAIAIRGGIASRRDEVRRLIVGLPRLASLRRLRESLEPLASLPEAPRGWSRDIAGLQKDEIELGVRSRTMTAEIDELAAGLDALVVDDDALRLADRVAGLADLRARHRTAERDLPERRLQLREVEGRIAGLLRRLDRDDAPDPRALLLRAPVTSRLRQAIERRSGVDAAQRSAATELSAARSLLEEAEATLDAAGGRIETDERRTIAMASLAAIVAALRTGDVAMRRQVAQRACDAAQDGLTARLRELRPWTGVAEDLAGMRVPDADTLEAWRAALGDAQKRLERHADEIDRMETEHRRLDAEAEAIGADPGVVSDQEAAEVRAARDQAWADHRQSLDAATADSFDAALRRDDAVTAGRFGRMSDVANLRKIAQARAIALAGRERATELRDAAARARNDVEDAVRDAAQAMSADLEALRLPQLEAWLSRRRAALEAWELVVRAEPERHEAEAQVATAHAALAAALAAARIPHDTGAGLPSLTATAEETLRRETALAALRSAVIDRRRDVERRDRDVRSAADEDRRWVAAWAEACSGCWLGQEAAPPSVDTVREVLPILADLDQALATRDGFADRIDKMEKDQSAFRGELADIAEQMGLVDTTGAVLGLAHAIDERIAAAHTARARRESERRKLDDARKRRLELDAAVEIHGRRADQMKHVFGVATLADVARALDHIDKRDDLVRQVQEVERELLDTLVAPTLDAAERALDAVDRPALEAELAALETRFDDVDQRCRDLFLAAGKAIDRIEAIGGDAKVAEIEQRRRTTLLEIEDGALRYLKLRAGMIATDHALRTYRDRHRSSMMARASDAFRTISRGAYSGLSTQAGSDGDVLIAVPAGGGSKQAKDLSKGTCFQLYLALRVAGYHEFAGARRSVPFIADDIMETFDDFRAEEAFRLFADMARVGQVIYLTHHRHLCEIARSVCPGVTVHHLGDGAAL